MKTCIRKWGNSLSVRIPRVMAAEIGLEENAAVELSLKKEAIVIYPLAKSKRTLKELLSGVNKNNLHGEADSGFSAGGEIW